MICLLPGKNDLNSIIFNQTHKIKTLIINLISAFSNQQMFDPTKFVAPRQHQMYPVPQRYQHAELRMQTPIAIDQIPG